MPHRDRPARIRLCVDHVEEHGRALSIAPVPIDEVDSRRGWVENVSHLALLSACADKGATPFHFVIYPPSRVRSAESVASERGAVDLYGRPPRPIPLEIIV